jgi:light-regulated signal transduction histidine kinase (bacteriophytochrome)
VKPEVLDMAGVARQCIAELETETRGRKVEWRVGALPPARADAALVRQVLTNLLSNALKFTRGADPARIEVGFAEGGYFVRDNGIGFDMQYVQKLFGVFQRLHSSSEFEGSGIGLANVQRIVHRHGGRAWAEGKPGEGACFHFTLPEGKDGADG